MNIKVFTFSLIICSLFTFWHLPERGKENHEKYVRIAGLWAEI
jgi:hypothetical protein